MSGKSVSGFTLIELLVLIAVLAVVATIAVPGFSRLIQSNQLTVTANDLIGALNLARSEAIRRGGSVSVEPTGSFTEGYQITDADGNTLNSFDGARGDFFIALSQGNNPRFSATGMLQGSNASEFVVCRVSGEGGIEISITAGGQIRSERITCP